MLEQICLPVAPVIEFWPSLDKCGASLLAAISSAAALTNKNPTPAQIAAGNYRKGDITVNGFKISIETGKGQFREGVDRGGRKWRTKMRAHYGYIKQTKGNDKQHIDVFIGDRPESELVCVINQVDPSTHKFDEHKVIFGIINEAEARELYLSCYEDNWQGLGSVKMLTIEGFKNWILDGDHTKKAVVEGELQANSTKPEDDEGWSILDGEEDGKEIGLPLVGA